MKLEPCTPEHQKLITGAALTAALELAGHWAPWPRRLPRLLAYGYGTLAIIVGAAVIVDRRTVARLATLSAAAGAATLAGHAIDRGLNRWARQRAGHDRNT